MSEKELLSVREWLLKEDERFSLSRLGLFSDVESVIEGMDGSLSRSVGESYPEWKQRVLGVIYAQLGFQKFYLKNRGEKLFKRGVKSILTAKLYDLFHKSEQTDTDRYIAPDNDTISYSLSDEKFDEISRSYLQEGLSDTIQISKKCTNAIEERYPLKERYVINHLESNDSFYWERVYRRLRPMVDGFSYQISGSSAQDEVYDIWSETCITLNSAVMAKKLQQPTTAKDVISYAVGIIKNKNRELLKGKKRGGGVSLDSVSYKVEYPADDNFFNCEEASPQNFSSQNKDIVNYIDINDEVAVRNHLVLALYNEKHPLHQDLVTGFEENVQILFEHYIDGVSYDDIVRKRVGPLPEKEMIKNVARVRQEIKRVKEKLIKRFIKLLKNRANE